MSSPIKTFPQKTLIGKQLKMSLANNLTGELWKSFSMDLKSLNLGENITKYSIQIYDNHLYFNAFNPNNTFTKWAAIEANQLNFLPDTMEYFTIPEGKYVVFPHKGTGTEIFNYIFGEWLPKSDYQLDDRPHFEILGEKYKQGSEESEEEIWVPIK